MTTPTVPLGSSIPTAFTDNQGNSYANRTLSITGPYGYTGSITTSPDGLFRLVDLPVGDYTVADAVSGTSGVVPVLLDETVAQASASVVVVANGASTTTARPTYASVVIWNGTVKPAAFDETRDIMAADLQAAVDRAALTGQPGGSVLLDANGKVPVANLPTISGSEVFFADGDVFTGNPALNTDLLAFPLRVPFPTVLRRFFVSVTPARVGGSTSFDVLRNGSSVGTVTIAAGQTEANLDPNLTLAENDRVNFRKTADASTAALTGVYALVSSRPLGGDTGGGGGGTTTTAYTPKAMPGVQNFWDVRRGLADAAILTDWPDTVAGITLTARTVNNGGATKNPLFRPNGWAAGKQAIELATDAASADGGPGFWLDPAAATILEGEGAGTAAAVASYLAGSLHESTIMGHELVWKIAILADGKPRLLMSNNGTSWSVIETAANAVSAGAPHVFVMLFGGGNATLRVDGADAISVPFTGTLPATITSDFSIGMQNRAGSRDLSGLVGHAVVGNQRLAGTALTDLETFLRTSAGQI